MILIDAVYIHESGGKALLEYLVAVLQKKNKPFFLLLDARLKSDFINVLEEENYKQIEALENNRKLFYSSLDNKIKSILCFSNVPPPLSIKQVPVFILFQNTLILSGFFEKNRYTVKQKILLALRRHYIHWKNKKKYQWIVQTSSMKNRLINKLGVVENAVSVITFFNEDVFSFTEKTGPFRFLYVADGVPQKNHTKLLDAWEYLFEQYQVSPELHLTIPERFTDLNKRIVELTAKGLHIVNHGRINKPSLNKLYSECQYLIFPSLAESFGLPLLEAVQAGCGVLAADLPYVYDVIKPSAVFNPFKPEEIANLIAEILRNNQVLPAEIVVKNEIEKLLAAIN
jgi:glycosyltransferase involved in cell wall biosynthesis